MTLEYLWPPWVGLERGGKNGNNKPGSKLSQARDGGDLDVEGRPDSIFCSNLLT